ncbi:hypothetical protein ILYODFUR_021810 [Ilyodon furcidens]|uniref:Uncharacterized protein n=1 Tax=Ilyodon furcidens TaxID=33524 RepID=A0ABV0TKM2_9TELE
MPDSATFKQLYAAWERPAITPFRKQTGSFSQTIMCFFAKCLDQLQNKSKRPCEIYSWKDSVTTPSEINPVLTDCTFSQKSRSLYSKSKIKKKESSVQMHSATKI